MKVLLLCFSFHYRFYFIFPTCLFITFPHFTGLINSFDTHLTSICPSLHHPLFGFPPPRAWPITTACQGCAQTVPSREFSNPAAGFHFSLMFMGSERKPRLPSSKHRLLTPAWETDLNSLLGPLEMDPLEVLPCEIDSSSLKVHL